MKKNNQQTGAQGERIAELFLIEQGYRLLARNYRHGKGEIDLIMQHKNTMVFVEVKARHSERFGYPEEAVSASKQELLLTTAEAYVLSCNWQGPQRFDILAIKLGDRPSLAHFSDAL